MRIPLLFILGIVSLVYAEEKPCTTYSDGKYYDLSNLKGRNDVELKTPGGKKLAINICQSVTTELFGLKDDIKADEVAGFVRLGHGDFSIGKVNTTLSVVDSNPRLVFSGGSRCKATPSGGPLDIRASTIIEFICDTSKFGAGQPRFIGQLPPGDDEVGCAYFIEWKTQFACPTNGGVWGFFAIIAVLILILLLTYTVLGTLYNRYVLQLRGFDQIPQFSIESMRYHANEAKDWFRDMLAAYNAGGAGGLPTTSRGSRTTNPVSHHTQASEDLDINPNNTFIRPQATFSQPSHQSTNPVSHHTQTQLEVQQTQLSSEAPPAPPPKAPIPQFAPRRVELGGRGPTREEREFMLGEDDDEGEEMQDKLTSDAPTVSPPSSENPTGDGTNTLNRGSVNIAAIRGRDTSEGNIRL